MKALESGEIPKAKEEPNIGISLITTRQKIIKLADKSGYSVKPQSKSTFLMNWPSKRLTPRIFFGDLPQLNEFAVKKSVKYEGFRTVLLSLLV